MKKLSHGIVCLLVVFMNLCAFASNIGWKHDFSRFEAVKDYPKGNQFRINNVAMENINGTVKAAAVGGNASFNRIIDVKLRENPAEGFNYLQIRIVSSSPKAWMFVTTGSGGPLLNYAYAKPGFYTIPLYRPALLKRLTDKTRQISLNTYLSNGYISFDMLQTVNDKIEDGVFFYAVRPDGTEVKPDETLKSGDKLTICMPVKAKPDSLRLSFFRLNQSKDWSKRGQWEVLDLPGAPLELKADAAEPLLYKAVFTVPELQQAMELDTLIAAVAYAGADSRSYGSFFGISPFNVKFAAGKGTVEENTAFRLFDFGPDGSLLQSGGKLVTPKETPSDFKWIRKVRIFENSFIRQFDALSRDWAAVEQGRPAEMEITVPPGRYKVITGIGAVGVRCWLNSGYHPMSAAVEVNGKPVFNLKQGEKDRFRTMTYEATEDEDLYDTYLTPYLPDIVTVTDASQGKIRIKVSSLDKPKTAIRFVAVYPEGDADGESRFARIKENRKLKFGEYWRDVSPSDKDIRSNLTVAEDKMPAKGIFIAARENPFEYIYPRSLPRVSEIGLPLVLTASPGEMISGVVMLRSIKNLKNLPISLTGYENMFRTEIYRIMDYRYTHPHTGRHWLAPNHFMPVDSIDLKAGKSSGVAVRFKLPEDVKSGVYNGKLTVGKGADSAELPVEVRVLPFKLPVLSDHLIAMLACSGEKHMRFSKEELGCTTASRMFSWPNNPKTEFVKDETGKIVGVINIGGSSMKSVDEWFKLYNKIGFASKTPFASLQAMSYIRPFDFGKTKPFTEEYQQAVGVTYAEILRLARANGLDNVVADLGGEMGHEAKVPADKTLQDAVRLFKLIKERVPEIKISYRANCWASVENFEPVLDVMGVRGRTSWVYSDRLTDYGRKKHIYSYSVDGRFGNGLKSWAHGARGNLREWLTWSHVIDYNDFFCEGSCGGTHHYEASPSHDGTLQPTLRSEAFRASVVDRQYIRLLENAIAESKNKKAVKNAKQFLDFLRGTILRIPDINMEMHLLGSNPWIGIRPDMVREICAALVLELKTGAKSGLPEFIPEQRLAFQKVDTQIPYDVNVTPERAKVGYDYSHWLPIKVGLTWESQGIPYDGFAWYRSVYTAPEGWTEPVIHFGAADEVAYVWVNGKYIGTHDGWNAPFSFKIDNWKAGEKNDIAVLVMDSTAAGGLWKPVTLWKDEESCRNKVKGASRSLEDWKIILEPGKRDLNKFELSEGPLHPLGTPLVQLSIFMVPGDDAAARSMAENAVKVSVYDMKGKKLLDQDIGKIVPYFTRKQALSVEKLPVGSYRIELSAGSEKLAECRFYILDSVKKMVK